MASHRKRNQACVLGPADELAIDLDIQILLMKFWQRTGCDVTVDVPGAGEVDVLLDLRGQLGFLLLEPGVVSAPFGAEDDAVAEQSEMHVRQLRRKRQQQNFAARNIDELRLGGIKYSLCGSVGRDGVAGTAFNIGRVVLDNALQASQSRVYILFDLLCQLLINQCLDPGLNLTPDIVGASRPKNLSQAT